jgi:hypothetical protein
MGGMQITPQPGQQQPPGQGVHAVRPAVLNQLYPTDLLNQPFNATELDIPPPAIVLPPNVSQPAHGPSLHIKRANPHLRSPVSLPRQMPTALPAIYGQLLTLCPPPTLC